MPAGAAMQALADMIGLHVEVTGLENVPRSGPAMIVANHPTGIADGIVLYGALAKIRPDLFFFANADAIRVLPQLADLIAPVEWRPEKRSHKQNRETMDYARTAFADGRLAVLFPSGRLAKRTWWWLNERPWMASGAMMARKFNLPVVPLHVTARNSALFYLFDRIHPTLRDITLFHEVLNKARQRYRLTIGTPIDPETPALRLRRGDRGAEGAHPRARRPQAADRADRPDLRPPARPEAGPPAGVIRRGGGKGRDPARRLRARLRPVTSRIWGTQIRARLPDPGRRRYAPARQARADFSPTVRARRPSASARPRSSRRTGARQCLAKSRFASGHQRAI